MKKEYYTPSMTLVVLSQEDIVRTSPTANVENMPDFPEAPPNFG